MEGKSKTYTVLCIVGSVLLVVMAIFHGSGYSFIKETIDASNSEEFLKEIIPTLFVHPSIHLIGLAAFGILAIYVSEGYRKVLLLLSLLIGIDAFLAFNLGGVLPGVLLLISALCFVTARSKKYGETNPS